jgi:hypothetical protein
MSKKRKRSFMTISDKSLNNWERIEGITHKMLCCEWHGVLTEEFPLLRDFSQPVTIIEGVTHIPQECFMHAPLTHVDFPDSLKVIMCQAFRNSNLVSINWGNSVVKEIHIQAFHSCDFLTMVGRLPDTCKFIGAFAFYDCMNIRNFSLPHGIRLDDMAFGPNLDVCGSQVTIRPSRSYVTFVVWVISHEQNPRNCVIQGILRRIVAFGTGKYAKDVQSCKQKNLIVATV